ncbi:MAG TPA: hypothetical protein VGQ67_15210, partial [Candidatus Polarisedimenticolia bacterium]|nr:hypothetical protein [Candidatus Polarisedimenticolia bacterium]
TLLMTGGCPKIRVSGAVSCVLVQPQRKMPPAVNRAIVDRLDTTIERLLGVKDPRQGEGWNER